MPMVRLVYFSTLTLDLKKDTRQDQINVILRSAQLHNLEMGLTGALIYDEKWLAQILEGERADLLQLYKRIERYNRHTNVALVEMAEAPARYFEIWSMSCAERTQTSLSIFAPFFTQWPIPARRNVCR